MRTIHKCSVRLWFAATLSLSTAFSQANLPLTQFSARPQLGKSDAVIRTTATGARAAIARSAFEEKKATFYPDVITDPGLGASKESVRLTFIDAVGEGDPYFRNNHRLVVLADVLSGNVFLSSNKRLVYTDFGLRVSQTLRADIPAGFSPPSEGDVIEASQIGGSLLFPSGHIKHFVIHDQGFLEIGGKYVLFLWADSPQDAHFEVMGAYRVKNEHLLSLSDSWPYNSMTGMTVSDFSDHLLARQAK